MSIWQFLTIGTKIGCRARSKSKCNFFKGKCCMTKIPKQLTMDERAFIQLGLMVALKPSQIALELSHSTSTIMLELKRNGWFRLVKLRSRGLPAHSSCYKSVVAKDRSGSGNLNK